MQTSIHQINDCRIFMNISTVLESVLEMHFEYKLGFLFLSVSHQSIVIKIILLTNF